MPNPWINDLPPLNSYPPLAMFIFKIFTIFPYKMGVILFLALSVISLLFPIIHHFLKSGKSGKYLGVYLFLILSTGYVSTLDRGNVIAFIVTPTYLFFYYFNSAKYAKANILLAFLISIKLYPVLLLLMYMKFSLMREAIRVIVYTAFVSALTLFVFPEPFKSAEMILHALLTGSMTPKFGTELLNPANISLAASFTQFATTSFSQSIELVTTINIAKVLSITYLILVVITIQFKSLSFDRKSLLIISTTWMVPQVSMPYVAALLVCVVVANIDSKMFQDFSTPKIKDKISNLLFICAIIATLAPIALPMHSTLGVDFNLMRPVAALCWYLVVVFELSRNIWATVLSRRNQ